jgi:hypothetical protein
MQHLLAENPSQTGQQSMHQQYSELPADGKGDWIKKRFAAL